MTENKIAFCLLEKNEYEQITLHDSFLFGLTDREKRFLRKKKKKYLLMKFFQL